jgi:hypothetical protein
VRAHAQGLARLRPYHAGGWALQLFTDTDPDVNPTGSATSTSCAASSGSGTRDDGDALDHVRKMQYPWRLGPPRPGRREIPADASRLSRCMRCHSRASVARPRTCELRAGDATRGKPSRATLRRRCRRDLAPRIVGGASPRTAKGGASARTDRSRTPQSVRGSRLATHGPRADLRLARLTAAALTAPS